MNTFKITLLLDTWSEDPSDWIAEAICDQLEGEDETLRSILTVRYEQESEDPAGHKCLCRASGKLITRKIQLLVGDRVTVELSPYDLDRGRITLRDK